MAICTHLNNHPGNITRYRSIPQFSVAFWQRDAALPFSNRPLAHYIIAMAMRSYVSFMLAPEVRKAIDSIAVSESRSRSQGC